MEEFDVNPCKNGGSFWFSTLDLEILWKTCVRSDWFLWVLEKGLYDKPDKLRKFACECVRRTPYGNKKSWSIIENQDIKNTVICTEQYLEGRCSKDDLKNSSIIALASNPSKYHFELFVPFVSDISMDSILVAKYVSWEMALSSGDLRKGLDYQADFIREIIDHDDMEKCALYIRNNQIKPPIAGVI